MARSLPGGLSDSLAMAPGAFEEKLIFARGSAAAASLVKAACSQLSPEWRRRDREIHG